ncbi:MAG: inositol monophosphatase [Dehalococcoidia bacterium]|nr:inositol monophosphatase [Dehalococcoidia bacterium]
MTSNATPSTPFPPAASGRTAREVALQVVMEAGALLRDHFQGELQVTSKGRGNVVTDLDHLVEAQSIRLLRREFPSFGILAEESAQVPSDSGYTWVMDPLDGTRNFASGLPVFSVVLGLARGDVVVLGMTYDPLRDELFLAETGKGATLNGKPIQAARQARVKDAVLAFDMGYSDERARNALKLMVNLWPGMQTIRILGSAALGLAYVASGRIDLYFHHLLSPWDIASGILLVREAGGVITDKDGKPATHASESIVAANPALHADFLRLTEGSDWRGDTPI